MKKVLILGCSHSAGAYNHNTELADQTTGWSALIANNFLNYEVRCFTHPGGGIMNYMWTLGHIINKFGKDYFDKIIIQITQEPRLTIYNIPLHFIKQSSSSNEIKDKLLECDKVNVKGTLYRYRSRCKIWDFVSRGPKNVDCEMKNYDEFDTILNGTNTFPAEPFLSLNLYVILMTENFLLIIKTLFGNSKLFSFRWAEYPQLSYTSLPKKMKKNFDFNKYNVSTTELFDMTILKWKKDFPFLLEKSAVEHVIETVGKKQEILYRMSDNSTHYDVHGNEMVYKYLEPHLKKFLI
jgi:hypothetical protein